MVGNSRAEQQQETIDIFRTERDSGKMQCHQASLDVGTMWCGLKTPERAQAQNWGHRTWGQRAGVGTIEWMQKEEKYQGFFPALQASAIGSLGGICSEARAREPGNAVPCHTVGGKEGQGIDLRTNRQMISGDYTKNVFSPVAPKCHECFSYPETLCLLHGPGSLYYKMNVITMYIVLVFRKHIQQY